MKMISGETQAMRRLRFHVRSAISAIEDEVHLLECLVDIDNGEFHARLNARAEFNPTTRRVNVRMWGGETEGGSIPSNLYDRFSSIYLQPLRDPESGLRPGRHSQISHLIDRLTDETKHGEFETIAHDRK